MTHSDGNICTFQPFRPTCVFSFVPLEEKESIKSNCSIFACDQEQCQAFYFVYVLPSVNTSLLVAFQLVTKDNRQLLFLFFNKKKKKRVLLSVTTSSFVQFKHMVEFQLQVPVNQGARLQPQRSSTASQHSMSQMLLPFSHYNI